MPLTEVNGIPGGQTVINGKFTQERANQLAVVLRAGVLPVPLHLVS